MHHMSTGGTMPPATPAPVQPEAVAAAQPARQARGGGGGGMVMNAAGGGGMMDDDEDEGEARDWLDWIYIMSRLGVLLMVVYFYSSLSRFLMVMALVIFMYLYVLQLSALVVHYIK